MVHLKISPWNFGDSELGKHNFQVPSVKLWEATKLKSTTTTTTTNNNNNNNNNNNSNNNNNNNNNDNNNIIMIRLMTTHSHGTSSTKSKISWSIINVPHFLSQILDLKQQHSDFEKKYHPFRIFVRNFSKDPLPMSASHTIQGFLMGSSMGVWGSLSSSGFDAPP